MELPGGLEPPTSGLGNPRSILLGYGSPRRPRQDSNPHVQLRYPDQKSGPVQGQAPLLRWPLVDHSASEALGVPEGKILPRGLEPLLSGMKTRRPCAFRRWERMVLAEGLEPPICGL